MNVVASHDVLLLRAACSGIRSLWRIMSDGVSLEMVFIDIQ